MRLKSIIVAVIILVVGLGAAYAESVDECVARCKEATGGAFGYIAYKDCVNRYCYKTIKPQGSVRSCDSIIRVIIRERLTWLDTGEVNDLTVDRMLSGGGELAQLIRYYFATGSVVTLTKLNEICEAAQSQR